MRVRVVLASGLVLLAALSAGPGPVRAQEAGTAAESEAIAEDAVDDAADGAADAEAEDADAEAEAERDWPGDPLVAQIQQGLQDLGYDVAKVDGIMGPNTRSAIEAFQTDEGLTVTGAASDAVRRAIEQRKFRESERAARLWAEARLYLRALGYSPGDGAFDSAPAQQALAAFAEDHWLELEGRFGDRLHDAVVQAARASARAQTWLCRHFVDAKDYDAAFDWCRRAAGQAVRPAQYYVGWMYYYGRGTERSYPDAFDWYRRAARAGDTRAMTYVGLMYRLGRGVERNPDAAIQWYRRATGDLGGGG
jgi:TPR repeat protein